MLVALKASGPPGDRSPPQPKDKTSAVRDIVVVLIQLDDFELDMVFILSIHQKP
jgi:hypothetical protein